MARALENEKRETGQERKILRKNETRTVEKETKDEIGKEVKRHRKKASFGETEKIAERERKQEQPKERKLIL